MADWHGVHDGNTTGLCDMDGYSTCPDPTGAACPSLLYDPIKYAPTDGAACRAAQHMATTHTMP